jgi:hypothetical protein
MYENTIRANFIELSEEHQLTANDFRDLLCKVKGVRDVALHPQSKEAQNNPGAQDPNNRVRRQGHYQAHNFMVFSDLYPDDVRGMEFELTESQHSKDPKLPLTISACYKEQKNNERSLEAWTGCSFRQGVGSTHRGQVGGRAQEIDQCICRRQRVRQRYQQHTLHQKLL